MSAVSAVGQGSQKVEYGGAVRVYVDSKLVRFKTPPITLNRRLLVPLRGVFEEMGASVAYDARRRSVTMNRGSISATLQVGKRIAKVNGANRLMDVSPVIRRGRVLVPLRFIAETLKASTEYVATERVVRIRSRS